MAKKVLKDWPRLKEQCKKNDLRVIAILEGYIRLHFLKKEILCQKERERGRERQIEREREREMRG
jgi:hypothetical protein